MFANTVMKCLKSTKLSKHIKQKPKNSICKTKQNSVST